MDLNKENIKEAFDEDIDNIKRGRSTTTYYIEDQGKLKLRNETMKKLNLKTNTHHFEQIIYRSKN